MRDINFLKNNNVNVDQSLELFGDIETYNETLLEFQKSLGQKLQEIDTYYKLGDMPNYAIYVHSLKSDCKYFGFITLADIAYQHELQSKANNYSFVKENYAALVTEANKVKQIVDAYLDESEETLDEVETEVLDEDIILVADDSEVIRAFVKKIFDANYELAFAGDGEEALNIIKSHIEDGKIKAILLDLNMPKVDGFAVLDFLKENGLLSKMPVTIISGDSSSDAINKAFTYEIVDMIKKPFNEAKIKEVVERTINKSN